jgi:hypothetical protein
VRSFPQLPRDRLQEAWEKPKTSEEWRRYYREKPPLRHRIEVFVNYLSYLAASDLCYIDHGLLARPEPVVIFALEYVADHLAEDPEVAATLYLHRKFARERETRWEAELCAVQLFKRIEGGDDHT